MSDVLITTYSVLVGWIGVGVLLFRVLPQQVPYWLGRTIFWVGIPIEIFGLARRVELTTTAWIPPIAALMTIGLSLAVALLCWQVGERGWAARRPDDLTLNLNTPELRSRQGSFLLTAMLANTGFVGLAIAPFLIPTAYWPWAVMFSVCYSLVGTYTCGVLCAKHYGRMPTSEPWIYQLRELLTVPALWGFGLGLATRSLPLPGFIEMQFDHIVTVVSAGALTLLGMRLSQVRDWSYLRWAITPALIRTVVAPLSVGLMLNSLAIAPGAQFALVLMAGTPSAFMAIVLAEEYDLERDLISTGIALSCLLLLLTIPLWLLLFPPI